MTQHDVRELIGRTAYGADDEKIGKIGQVFLDDGTGEPDWIAVDTGLFGSNQSLVPLAGASVDGDDVRLAHSKDTVKDAPNVDVEDGHLPEDEERRLYDHYGVAYQASSSGRATGTSDGTAGTTDDAMTRSEERVEVGTTTQEAGRARLRKYVETEHVTTTVPVRKEKAVLETEPITADNVDEATSGEPIGEDEHEVVLREEKPVVQKTTEPVERVRLGTEQTTEQQEVGEEVRKERIVAEGDVEQGR